MDLRELCKIPTSTGHAGQRRREQRFCRYIVAFATVPLAFYLMTMGGTVPNKVDVALNVKYRDLVTLTDADDTAPPFMERVNNPVRGTSYGGSGADALDTGKPFTLWVGALANHQQHMAGAKPILLSVGPFVYRVYDKVYDVEFSGEEKNQLRYKQRDVYVFDGAASTNDFSPNGVIVVPNPAWRLMENQLKSLYPQATDMEDFVIPWMSGIVMRAMLSEAIQQYKQRWYFQATLALFTEVRDRYGGNQNRLADDFVNQRIPSALANFDAQYLSPEENLSPSVAFILWNPGSGVSFMNEIGSRLMMNAIQERIASGSSDWNGPDFVTYRDVFRGAFLNRDVRYRVTNSPLASRHAQLLLNWTMNFLGSPVNNPHGAYLEDYIAAGYAELGVAEEGLEFADIVGFGLGSNGALGVFEKLAADELRDAEIRALERFRATYNSTGNLTIPLAEAEPPRSVFNESYYFLGTSIHNNCPNGTSIFDNGVIRSRYIRDRPEFSCYTTGNIGPKPRVSFRSKVSAQGMNKLFRQMTSGNALFGLSKPTVYPNVGQLTGDHHGSRRTLDFWLMANEVLNDQNVSQTLADYTQRIIDAQDAVLAEIPESENRTLRLIEYDALLAEGPLVYINRNCTTASDTAGFGELDCLQLHDLLSWLEFLALEWVYNPDFVYKSKNGEAVNALNLNAGPFIRVSVGDVLFNGYTDNLYSFFTATPDNPSGDRIAPLFTSHGVETTWLSDVYPDLKYEFTRDTGLGQPGNINKITTYKDDFELTLWGQQSPVRGQFDPTQFPASVAYRKPPHSLSPNYVELWSHDALRPLNFTKTSDNFVPGQRPPYTASFAAKEPEEYLPRYVTDDNSDVPRCMVTLGQFFRGVDVMWGKPYGLGCDNVTEAALPTNGIPVEVSDEVWGSRLTYELMTGITTEAVTHGSWFHRYKGSYWLRHSDTVIFPMFWRRDEYGTTAFLDPLKSDVLWTLFLVERFYPHFYYLAAMTVVIIGGCFLAWGIRSTSVPYHTGIQRHYDFPVREEDKLPPALQLINKQKRKKAMMDV